MKDLTNPCAAQYFLLGTLLTLFPVPHPYYNVRDYIMCPNPRSQIQLTIFAQTYCNHNIQATKLETCPTVLYMYPPPVVWLQPTSLHTHQMKLAFRFRTMLTLAAEYFYLVSPAQHTSRYSNQLSM